MATSSKQAPRDSLYLSWERRQESLGTADTVMGSAKNSSTQQGRAPFGGLSDAEERQVKAD